MSMRWSREAFGIGSQPQQATTDPVKARRAEINDLLRQLLSLLYSRVRGAWSDDEEREYSDLRRKAMESGELAEQTLGFLRRNRRGNDVYANVVKARPSYRERERLIDDAFDPTFDRLDGVNDLQVEIDEDKLQALNMANAKALWRKARLRLKDDPVGAVTLTRSLLETVCKRILTSLGETYTVDDSLAALCKRCLKLVLPDGLAEGEHFKKFVGAATTMVEHIALYRNKVSDAHGSEEEQQIADHHAEYAVSLAGSTAVFLVECFATKHGGEVF